MFSKVEQIIFKRFLSAFGCLEKNWFDFIKILKTKKAQFVSILLMFIEHVDL